MAGNKEKIQKTEAEKGTPAGDLHAVLRDLIAQDDPQHALRMAVAEGRVPPELYLELSQGFEAFFERDPATALDQQLLEDKISTTTWRLLQEVLAGKMEVATPGVEAEEAPREVLGEAPVAEEEKPAREEKPAVTWQEVFTEAKNILEKYRGQEVPSSVLEALREKVLQFPKEERTRMLRDFGTFILAQAEKELNERNAELVRVRLEFMEVIFGSESRRAAEAAYLLYGVLHHKTGFRLGFRGYPPLASITNFAHLRNQFRIWFSQERQNLPEQFRQKLEDALGALTQFLQMRGPREIRERILEELEAERTRAVEEELITRELNVAKELAEAFLPKNKEELLERLDRELEERKSELDRLWENVRTSPLHSVPPQTLDRLLVIHGLLEELRQERDRIAQSPFDLETITLSREAAQAAVFIHAAKEAISRSEEIRRKIEREEGLSSANRRRYEQKAINLSMSAEVLTQKAEAALSAATNMGERREKTT